MSTCCLRSSTIPKTRPCLPNPPIPSRRQFHDKNNAFITGAPPPPSPPGSSPRPPKLLAVKDNIATHSHPTTAASSILSSHQSPIQATIVSHLLTTHSYTLAGKTNLDEFGMGSHSTHSAHGSVTNPAARGRSAGGSSGGSAVAVQRGDVELALGTDTGGSVRLPAAYTGVVGYKPSYGMVSRYGVIPYATSLDTVGFLAKTIAPIRNVLLGVPGTEPLYLSHDPKDPTSLSLKSRVRCLKGTRGYTKARDGKDGGGTEVLDFKGIRFGIPIEYNIAELDPRIRSTWLRTAERARELGAEVLPVSLPTTKHALSAYYIIAPAEASSNLAKYDGVRYGVAPIPPTPSSQKPSSNSKSPSDYEVSDSFVKPPPAQPSKERTAENGREGEGGGEGEGEVKETLYSRFRGANFGPEVRRRILLGSYSLSAEAMDNYFIQAQRVRRLVRRDFDRVFRVPNALHSDGSSGDAVDGWEVSGGDGGAQFDLSDIPEEVEMENKTGPAQVDFLLCPTAPTLPPKVSDVGDPLEEYVNDVFTVPASLAGVPAVSVPVGLASEEGEGERVGEEREEDGPGLVGMQVIGQYWDDARMLDVAERLVEG